jgi:hypothetical protein
MNQQDALFCYQFIFNKKPLHVSSRLAAHRQEDQTLYKQQLVYVMRYVDWLMK